MDTYLLNESGIIEIRKTIYKVAFNYVKNDFDANDIVQETFYRYYKQPRYLESFEHVKAWFIKVAINCSKTFLTNNYRNNKVCLDDIPEISINEEYSDESTMISSLDLLPAKQKNCLYLFYYKDMSIKEIANVTKENDSTIKSHLFRGKNSLKLILKETI